VNKKDLLIRFILGGTAVMLSYIVTMVSPLEILAGIFAAFPAVMITAILMMGITSGSKHAAQVANGSIYGMIGGVVCVVTVWLGLKMSDQWIFSVCLGLLFWLVSSIIVSRFRDHVKRLMTSRA
jgi:uncharacterized membrane protein (GlpM family)